MYKVYCDDVLIYHQNIDELKLTSAKVELEQNNVGTFEFTIYPTNPYINNVKDMQSIIRVYQDDYLLFRGLATNSYYGYRNQKTVKCKQDYHFLTFSIQRAYTFKGTPKELFQKFIDEHNKQVEAKHRFIVGEVNVTDPNNYINRGESALLTTWESIQKKLIEPLGGYLRLRQVGNDTYIDYLNDFSVRNAQEIKFGENMLDVTRESSGLGLATRLIPLGARIEGQETESGAEKRVDITSVNGGIDYVEDVEAVKKYGCIEFTETWDDVHEPSILLSKAKKRLADKIYKIVSIEVTALDMAHVSKDISNFKMHNYIKVVSEFHGINEYYLPLKMNINLFQPQDNKIALNATRKTLTDVQVDRDKNYGTIIEELGNIKDHLEKLSVDLTSDNGVFQVFNKDKGTFEPNFETDNLVIKPHVTLGNAEIPTTSVKTLYKRLERKQEVALEHGETVVNNQLVISKNMTQSTTTYVCHVTYVKGDKTYTASDFISVVRVENGEDSVLLYIDSSNGAIFKNTGVSTTLTVSIFAGGEKIDTYEKMKARFGNGAFLVWESKKFGETKFTPLSKDDPRIKDNGFILTIQATDIDTKTTFNCSLDY